MEQSISGHAQ
jgi:hypothetical protein